MKKILLMGMLFAANAFSVEPVTGVWGDTADSQKRTGYSIEVQNNFLVMSMYTYSKDNASSDPTWYNTGGFLKQNNDGTASGTFELYTVSDNRSPGTKGNVMAGSLDIVFKDRETANITWHDFPGHSQANSTIKKYWFMGTDTSPQAKRLASTGLWQYSMGNGIVDKVLYIEYFDPNKYANKYAAISNTEKASKTLLGRSDGSNIDNVVKIFDAEGGAVTIVKDLDGWDYFFIELGGAEYSKGAAAKMFTGVSPKPKDFKYVSSAVQAGYRDSSGKMIAKSISSDKNKNIQELYDISEQLNYLTEQ